MWCWVERQFLGEYLGKELQRKEEVKKISQFFCMFIGVVYLVLLDTQVVEFVFYLFLRLIGQIQSGRVESSEYFFLQLVKLVRWIEQEKWSIQ